MPRLIVIGIDGATWRVINPLIEQGHLPNIARLRDGGSSGTLRAFSHLLTSAALWTTINSGKTEKQHGIEFFGSTSRDVKTKRIWDILQEYGWRVGVCGELMTWPPTDVNGFMIPDLFALGPETHPAEFQFLQEFALGQKEGRPASAAFARKLLRSGIRPQTLVAGASFMARRAVRRGDPYLSWFWHKALVQPRIYADVTARLAKQYRTDYLTFHFHTTDTLSHRYWKYWEPEAFDDVTPEDVERYGQVIPAAYRVADDIVGQLAALGDEDSTIAIVSDHGFSPIPKGNYKYTFRLDRCFTLLGIEQRSVVPARLGATHVLYSRDEGLNDRIAEALQTIRVERTGEPLFLVRRGDNFVSFLVADRKQILTDESFSSPSGMHEFRDLFEDRGYVDSGEHHPDGVFILNGPGIRRDHQVENASILDITPTLLAIAGLPVGRDMAGAPLVDVLTDPFLERHPISYCDSYEMDQVPEPATEDGDEDSEMVMERLRALGYL